MLNEAYWFMQADNFKGLERSYFLDVIGEPIDYQTSQNAEIQVLRFQDNVYTEKPKFIQFLLTDLDIREEAVIESFEDMFSYFDSQG